MKVQNTICVIIVTLALGVAGVSAQSQKPDAPVSPLAPVDARDAQGSGRAPAGAARGVSSAFTPEPASYNPLPDSNTLAGAELFGLGSLQNSHNVFDPSISFSELGRVTTGAGVQHDLGSETIFNGTLDFSRTWSRYRLTTLYNGGGIFDRGSLISNQQYHEMTLAQQIDWARWSLLLRDDFTATSGSAFTGAGMGGPGLMAQTSSLLDGSSNSMGQAFIPSESIQTGNAMRYRNSALGQAEYSFSRRSAFTFSGSYGLLDFANAGYVSSRMLNAQAGYDYLLSPEDSIALLASYGKITYVGSANSTTDYLAALAYGRKITGRLAFQVQAGPEQVRSKLGTGMFQLWLYSVNTALTYERRRSGVSLSFMSGLSSGSGVFLGARSNTVSATAHHQFTRFWVGTVNGGYALNHSLVPAGTTAARFDNWFVGANLGRQMGPHARINFNYGVQRQMSPAACPVLSCGATGYQQTFGMSVNWHLRPTD